MHHESFTDRHNKRVQGYIHRHRLSASLDQRQTDRPLCLHRAPFFMVCHPLKRLGNGMRLIVVQFPKVSSQETLSGSMGYAEHLRARRRGRHDWGCSHNKTQLALQGDWCHTIRRGDLSQYRCQRARTYRDLLVATPQGEWRGLRSTGFEQMAAATGWSHSSGSHPTRRARK